MNIHKSSKSINVEIKEIGSYDDYFEHGDKDIEWTPGTLKYRASTKTLIVQREVPGQQKSELKLKLVIGVTSVRKENDDGVDNAILFLKLLNANKDNEYLNFKFRTNDSNWQTMFIKFLNDLCPASSSSMSAISSTTTTTATTGSSLSLDSSSINSNENEKHQSSEEKDKKKKKQKSKDNDDKDETTITQMQTLTPVPTLISSYKSDVDEDKDENESKTKRKSKMDKDRENDDDNITQTSVTQSSSSFDDSSEHLQSDDKKDVDENEASIEDKKVDEKQSYEIQMPILTSETSAGGVSICNTPRSDSQLFSVNEQVSSPTSAASNKSKKSKSGFHLRSIFNRSSAKKSPPIVASTSPQQPTSPKVQQQQQQQQYQATMTGSDTTEVSGGVGGFRKKISRSSSFFSQLRSAKRLSIDAKGTSQNFRKIEFVPPQGNCNFFGDEAPVPYSVAFSILESLSLKDLAQCTRVNKTWHELAEYPHLWFQKCFALGLDVKPESTVDTYKKALCDYRKKISRQLPLVPEGHNGYPREHYQSILTTRVRDVNLSCMNGIVNLKSGRRTKKRWIVLMKGCLVVYRSKKNDEVPVSIIPLNGRIFAQVVGAIPSVVSYSSASSSMSYSSAMSSSSSMFQMQHYSVHSASPSSASPSAEPADNGSSPACSSVSPVPADASLGSPTMTSSPVVSTPATPSRLSVTSGKSGHFRNSGKQFYFKLDSVISYSLDSSSSVKENAPESWLFFTDNIVDANEWVSLINCGIETFSQLIPTAVIVVPPVNPASSDPNVAEESSAPAKMTSLSSSSSSSSASATTAKSPSPRPTITSINRSSRLYTINGSNRNASPNIASATVNASPVKRPIFGKSIDEIMDRQMEEGTVCITPDFLHAIFSHLEKTSTEVEGIFRVSGSEQEVAFIQHELEEGKSVDFAAYSPHTLTSFVKAFFKSMPEPIIPPKINKVIDNTLKKIDIDAKDLPDDYCEMINQTLVSKLSMSSMALLKELVRLFNKIVEKASINKMTLDNLFIVILPTLQCAPSVLAAMMAKPNALLGSDLFGGFM